MLSYRKLKDATCLCEGVRPGHKIPCNGTLYRCKYCGNTGCRQTTEGRCSHQGFDVRFGCVKCRAIGQQEVVAGPA